MCLLSGFFPGSRYVRNRFLLRRLADYGFGSMCTCPKKQKSKTPPQLTATAKTVFAPIAMHNNYGKSLADYLYAGWKNPSS